MPKQTREEVDVTSALKNILDNYPAGSATLREILQNTDDAGAKKQAFILDTRTFSSDSLVGSELHVCQGPAIIATNDAYFKPKDWKAILTILNSSKTQDETSTGKYGLGFRSCYHVTDNPHILSGDKLLILDPHARVEQYQGGVELDTKNAANKDGEIEREVYKGHFATFSSVFQPDDDVYPGTAIRLPLRPEGFQSKLKSTPTKVEDARKMFKDFITKELQDAMLFLKNINEIKLLEIDEEGNETVSATATIENADAVAVQRSGEGTKQGEISHHPITITMQVGAALPFTSNWIITQFGEKYATASGLAKRLKRPPKDVEEAMSMDKLLPRVALALPVPSDGTTSITNFRGRLFTLLPLPIITGFPVHVNAVLALVSSRQNLRNSMDVEVGSREEFLVEWNRVIFSELVPKAWASLLDHLVVQSSLSVFEAWPSLVSTKDGDQGYWNPLPPRLLEETADRSVWPLHGRSSEYSTLKDVLVTVEGQSTAPLQALQACNIPMVVVPERVFRLIKQSEFRKAILSPQTVYPHLKRNTHSISDIDAGARKSICDYLVSANDIGLLLDLPLIPQVQGKHTSISTRTKHVMATKSEAAMFGNVDQTLLAEDSMSAATRQLILNDPADRVRLVGPADVARYLEGQVPTMGVTSLANISTGVNAKTFEWLIKFWTWLDGWEKFDQLVNHSAWNTIQNLHALPLRWAGGKTALRLVGKSAVRPGNMDPDAVVALAALEVPMLDGSMSSGLAVRYVSKDSSDITFILQSIPKNKSFSHLDFETRVKLFVFFTQGLHNDFHPGLGGLIQVPLNKESRDVLRNLPIFPILNPGSRDNDNITLGVAPFGTCFVNDSVKVIPSIRGVPFVNHDFGRILHLALGEREILDEIAVLRKAISPDAWSQQDRVTGLLPALIDRLINRLNDVGEVTRARISELAIVEVGVPARRKAPNQVVDPASALAELYDAEDEVLPVGAFGSEGPGTYIHQLRSYRMLRTALTPPAIEERITRLSDQLRPLNDRSGKALRLLGLLDSYTQSKGDWLPAEVVKMLCDSEWLPVVNRLHTPSECWDTRENDVLLCDMVLPRVQFTVRSRQLRHYLGWGQVPFHVLQSQLLKVLETGSGQAQLSETDVLDRIEAVLKAVAARFQGGRLSQEHIQALVDALGDLAWVPTTSRNRCVARQGMLEPIDLGMKYYSVAPHLLRFPGMEMLLKQMGVCNRPAQASLFSTLRDIGNELSERGIGTQTRNRLVQASVLILDELSQSIQGTESEFPRILVPTESCQLAPAPGVLFNDMGGDPIDPPPGLQFAHSLISASLANTLGLRRMSEEDFAEAGEGIQSFHIGEDLTVRIRKVLQDYDIDHSSNEWVANAEDAGAKSVTFMVDEASFHGRRVIGGLASFQSGPALVVHNDKIFTDEDFRGLGNIGEGGKAGRADSIGRFGLGALSFYHFSELPWVISGKWCLFLDPSKQYLPRERGNIRRSAALVPLSFCKNRYPDQLKPLEGLFGFSSEIDNYDGTLFRFPLRTASQAAVSKLSKTHFSALDITNKINRFYSYASQSLFFTKSVAEITAFRRTADLRTTPVWSARSACEPISQGVPNDINATNLSLKMKPPQKSDEIVEQWIVTRSQVAREEFPTKLQALFPLHRLPTPTIGLAACLSTKRSNRDSRLFATLPLPVSTSLPVHIHATWVLAQDRRSIRYDAPDAANHRPDDTLYNVHLLEKGVAPLYVKTLALMLRHHPKSVRRFWPGKALDPPSQTVAVELYTQIITTQQRVLLSAQGQPITPANSIIHLSTKTPYAVRDILSKLKVHNYVPRPFIATSFREDWGSLRFDTASEVSTMLRGNVAGIRALWLADAFTLPDVLCVLGYLLEGGQSLDGIPLLARGDNQLVEFRSSVQSVNGIFASHRAELARFFGPSMVLSLGIPENGAQYLATLGLNVRMLDQQGMRNLLAQHSPPLTREDARATSGAQLEWHKDLLKFLTSSGCPVKVQDLADLPLLPAVGRELVVSLNHARSGKIWWRSPFEDRALTAVLLQLGVITVDYVPGEAQRPEVNDLARILQLFGRLNFSAEEILRRVARNDWDAFVQYLKPWIQDHYIARLSNSESQTLDAVPFFKGRRGTNQLSYVPASQVMMLPDSAPLDTLAPYLPPTATFAASSSELAAVLRRGRNTQKSLSFPNLFRQLQIPRQLSQNEDASFSSLIPLIATHHIGTYNSELIPDGNRVLRRPNELFDHRVILFSTAFEGRPDLFVHSSFRHLIDRLVSLGVKREVTSQRLLECIQAIDRDARQGQEVLRRARWLWNYVNAAPQQIREIAFSSIRGQRFIPRHSQRHPSDPDFDQYARGLPDVVSPDELCGPNREAVAWTQRARFATGPTDHLKAVYPSIGEPSGSDVVRHLSFLVNQVAPSWHQSSILFSDVRSVYNWMKCNQGDVNLFLKRLAKRPLWLNISSDLDDWTWRAADELVFDLTYDVGGRFVVQAFLLPYRSLLVDAGAHEYRVASLPQPKTLQTTTPHWEVMRSGWSQLRTAGQLFDVCFKVEGQKIPAHRGMLAAMVPHFMTAFSGSFRESIISSDESELPIYRLPEDEATSAFAVRAVIDYVYTGAFSHPSFSDIDEATAALDDLLDLMELSSLWDIPELTNQAVSAIVELRLIRFDNCPDVLARAEACQMRTLIDVCRKTMRQNKWA